METVEKLQEEENYCIKELQAVIGSITMNSVAVIKEYKYPPQNIMALAESLLIIFDQPTEEKYIWRDFQRLLKNKGQFVETIASGP